MKKPRLKGKIAYDLPTYIASDYNELYPIRLHDGTIIRCKTAAGFDWIGEDRCYVSLAQDDTGVSYLVRWEITHPDPDNCFDESLMCDWDKFVVIKL